MCIFFSCIIVRDGRILFCEDGSHETVIERADLKDNKLVDRDFVRIEVRDGNISNYREDEHKTLPGWYNKEETIKKLELVLFAIKVAWEEYRRIGQQAWKDHNRIGPHAWEEYDRTTQHAWEEYVNELSNIKGYTKE